MLSCQYYGTSHTPSTHFGPAGPGPRPERLARRLTRPWALFYIPAPVALRSEEHTSELHSLTNLRAPARLPPSFPPRRLSDLRASRRRSPRGRRARRCAHAQLSILRPQPHAEHALRPRRTGAPTRAPRPTVDTAVGALLYSRGCRP